MRLLLATANPHKLRELGRVLDGVALEGLPARAPTPDEHGATYAENALIKARAAAEGTGQPAFADDSGIEAEALDWRPGVRTARFAGEQATDGENLAKLHREAPAGSRAVLRSWHRHRPSDGESSAAASGPAWHRAHRTFEELDPLIPRCD